MRRLRLSLLSDLTTQQPYATRRRTDKDGKKLTHNLVDGKLVSDIVSVCESDCVIIAAKAALDLPHIDADSSLTHSQIGTVVNWTETTSVDGAKLTTSYSWKNADGTDGKCAQHFEKSA